MAAPSGFISKTEKGSKYLFIGLLLTIIYLILTVGIAFSLQDDMELLTSDPDMEDPEVTERFFRIIGAFCGAMIILLIGLILVLIGIIYIYTSRAEFGEEHAGNMQTGLIFLVVAFVVGIVGSLLVGGMGGGANASNISALIIISGIIAIITSILYGLGFIYIFKKLLDKKGNEMVKIGAILLIIFSIINVAVLGIRYSMDDDFTSLSSNYYVIGLVLNLISIIPWAIFAFSFYRAWKRIQWGVIKPVFIPYPVYPPYPPHPGYPPPPGGMPPPPIPPGGPPGKPNACPSCGYILPYQETTCPKCGYNLSDK
jgi:hypothetical protein